ncbi:hypothetical protein KSP40_PGU009927 [Platanthera guangdongensis]|uniref:Uncharacterized protein n=1 Tax=Platanthera guangdongensis TaxID=2320717 RepID=A0ABR2MKI0_9ASPA
MFAWSFKLCKGGRSSIVEGVTQIWRRHGNRRRQNTAREDCQLMELAEKWTLGPGRDSDSGGRVVDGIPCLIPKDGKILEGDEDMRSSVSPT